MIVGAIVLFVIVQSLRAPAPVETGSGMDRPGLRPPADTSEVVSAPSLPAPPSPVQGLATGLASDGSIELDSGVRVRMFGVAMPTAADAPLVRQTARETLGNAVRGQQVALEFDPILTADQQKGNGIQIGYVWLIDEAGYRRGMLNALVLAYGFGRPVESIPYRYAGQFAEASRIARNRQLGVWTSLNE